MSSAAKIGLLMLVILAIIGYFILKIEDIDIGGEYRQVKASFEDVGGLDVGSAVRVAGVRKGKVTDVKVVNGKAEVTLDLQDDVKLYRNATIRVSSMGLLGEKQVEIDPGTPDNPQLTGETIIMPGPGADTPDIEDVTAQVSAIANDVKAITESMRSVMAGPTGQQRLEDIVENVRAITAQVRELVAANRSNVDATMANMREITASLRVEIPRLAASLDRAAGSIGGTVGENREDVRRIVDNLRTLSSDLRVTADNLNSITGQVKSGEGTVGKLIYSDEAHDRLTKALGSVESGVNELRDTLGRANRIGLDIGIKADYYAGRSGEEDEADSAAENFDFGGNSRTAVGVRIIPNPDRNRFYNVEVSDDPRGKRRDKVIIQEITDSLTGQTQTITTRETKFDRDFLVSAQAGWVLDDLALRIGLFDSAGGVGADYQFNERLRVSGEVFDFGKKRDDSPHIRLFGEYTFRRETDKLPRLFLTSGVDNALNDTAIIFGGGIRWRDDDLKYLLGSVPLGR